MDFKTDADRPIAILGAGFSGTMTALHLLARTPPARTILLCERGAHFARGTAYGAEDPGHLLNVRAANMSALPDEPDHFVRWLATNGPHDPRQVRATPAGVFVSRWLYGSYLTALLSEAVAAQGGASRLILVPDEAIDLARSGDGFTLELAGGRRIEVAAAVLAVGTVLHAGTEVGPYIANPWSCRFTEGLRPDEPVVVIGSGLTMVDVTMQLRHAGFTGPVVALSRHGLRPHVHAPAPARPAPSFTAREAASPARLLRRLRAEARAAEAEGAGWRSVVDSIRPSTSTLWRGLDRTAQRRFLRHARPWWDIHRHRMAPPVGEAIEHLVQAGRLTVLAGHVESIVPFERGAEVTYRSRHGRDLQQLCAQRVINATGAPAPDACGNPLLTRLIDSGLARLDEHKLGLALADGFRVVGADGRAVPGLSAVGPLGLGTLWECTAVPDIRLQVAEVAASLATELEEGAAPSPSLEVRRARG